MDFNDFAAYMGGRIANPRSAQAMPRGRPTAATATGLLVQPAARGASAAEVVARLQKQLRAALQEVARLRQENDLLRQHLTQAQEAAKTAWRGRGEAVEDEGDVEAEAEGAVEVEDESTVREDDLDPNSPWGPDDDGIGA